MPWLIDLFPIIGADPITYEVDGATLTVNGEPYDFGFLDEGDIYPADAIPGAETWLRSTEVTLWEGKLRACVVLPLPADVPLAIEARHPGPVEVTSGPVPLPTDGVLDASA
jgi:hypothetical protein